MRINFTPVSDYDELLFTLIRRVEDERRAAYFDSEGIPSIGIGFNMTSATIQAEIYEQFGFFFDAIGEDQAGNNRDTLSELGFTEERITQILAQEQAYRTQIDTAIAQAQANYAANPPTTQTQRAALDAKDLISLDSLRAQKQIHTLTRKAFQQSVFGSNL